jgi:hypothetical protein
MKSTLELAVAKASLLPEAAQERLGLELLERIAALEQLRSDIDVGVRELDSGLGRSLDLEKVIRRGRERLAKG